MNSLLFFVVTGLLSTPICGHAKVERRAAVRIIRGPICPSCASMMLREMERPSPIPSFFVVKKRSKTCSIFFSGMPTPRSVTDTCTALFSNLEAMNSWRSEEAQSAIASQAFSTRLSRTS